MITNERQYRISKSWLARFEQARNAVEQETAHLQPRARQAFRDQYESQIDELRAQLEEYETLRRGRGMVLELQSLRELPDALIRARTAAGLTQKVLAERLGVKEQQIQRYEATRYAGVSLERLQAVADALGAVIREQVVLPAVSQASEEDGVEPPRPDRASR